MRGSSSGTAATCVNLSCGARVHLADPELAQGWEQRVYLTARLAIVSELGSVELFVLLRESTT